MEGAAMRSLRTLCLLALGGLLALPLSAVAGGTASATTGTARTTVYSRVTYCVQASAAIDTFTGTFSGNLGYANAYLVARDINGVCNRAMTGSGRARVDVQVWNGSAWQFCRGSDWAYGSFGWSSGELGGPYGPAKIVDYGGSASCGAGYYRAVAVAEYDTGQGWVGGSIASPYLWVS
ncbi:hypothetical protein AB0425_22050 [Actinosynnema sp. NPDC051121]